MDSALALIAKGRPVKQVCELLGVVRSNVAAKRTRPADWRDGRQARRTDDNELVEQIRQTIADLPSYKYRRGWGLLRRERERKSAAPVNAKRVYRVMRVHGLLLQRRTMPARPERRHDDKVAVSNGDVVRDVMLVAVENRFGNALQPPSEIEWLSDNGSGYIAERTRQFAMHIGLKPVTTPVSSPQSNGMAESFV